MAIQIDPSKMKGGSLNGKVIMMNMLPSARNPRSSLTYILSSCSPDQLSR